MSIVFLRSTFLVEVLSESLKRSLACPPPTGVSGTLGAAESVTGAMTGAATGVGTDTGEIGGVSSETLFFSLQQIKKGIFSLNG